MSKINPGVITPSSGGVTGSDAASRTKRVRVLARLLDSSMTVPGTGWKFGLDPIIGLIPGIGDLVGAVMSGYIILEAVRADVPAVTLVRMLVNVGIDTVIGAVPAVGDVFDAAWKSNTMNVALLERHVAGSESVPGSVPVKRRNVLGVIAIALIVLVLIVGAGLALGIYVARLLWGLTTR